jgi:hypothetical protein
MKFDGVVGEVESRPSECFYEVSYVGKDVKRLREYVLEQCRRKGLEVVSVTEGERDGDPMVTARVRSLVGIL